MLPGGAAAVLALVGDDDRAAQVVADRHVHLTIDAVEVDVGVTVPDIRKT